jgi:hypothetical protein
LFAGLNDGIELCQQIDGRGRGFDGGSGIVHGKAFISY